MTKEEIEDLIDARVKSILTSFYDKVDAELRSTAQGRAIDFSDMRDALRKGRREIGIETIRNHHPRYYH